MSLLTTMLTGGLERIDADLRELAELRALRDSIRAEIQSLAPLLQGEPEWVGDRPVLLVAKEVIARLKKQAAQTNGALQGERQLG